MAKKSRKKSSNNGIKITLLAICIALVSIITYEHFRSPILQAANTAKSITSVIAETEKEDISGDLEHPEFTVSRPQQLITHAGYSVSFNPKWHLPNWVAYELTKDETSGSLKRSDKFVADPEVKESCATNDDYAHSGYDRGHMAPAADMKWNSTAMKECFYFSNMCPQKHSLNAGKWKSLEEKGRDWAEQDSAIIIICGPIVEKGYTTIGEQSVVVPQKFFKVILSPYLRNPKAIGFIMRNDKEDQPLKKYAYSIDEIEKLVGMDFFSALPDNIENKIEASYSLIDWGL